MLVIVGWSSMLQLDDGTLGLILDIICKIYRGEESLCVQFWDRDSFIDGPIRSLLNTLEVEFPFRVTKLVRLLSALCEGTWPAECTYNFLDRSVGISSMFVLSGDGEENFSQTVKTPHALNVPEVEDLLIPSQTRGRVLRVIDRNTVLVRWEYKESGVLVLLLRLARQLYLNNYEETHSVLDLLYRLVSFNKAVCSSLVNFDDSSSMQTARINGCVENSMRVDVVEIVCTLVRNLSPNVRSVVVMSRSVSILTEMLKCSPSHVSEVVLKKNIFNLASKTDNFDMHTNDSGMWLLSGGLARMLSIDAEQTEDCCSLTLSLLDFTKQLLETGAEDDVSMALVVFCLQYIFVNHELWKYRVKCARWKVTLKVLELLKICLKSIPSSLKLSIITRDIILCDSSVHSTLCWIMCITAQTLEKLRICRLYDVEEIEGLQMAVRSALDVVFNVLTALPKDTLFSLPGFYQTMLSSTTKPIPVVTAVISLISFFYDHAIQVGAAKVLSMLCIIAENTEPRLFGTISLVSDDKQITGLRSSIFEILGEETPRSEDLLVATLKLLTSAACHQPAFLISIMAPMDNTDNSSSSVDGIKQKSVKASLQSLKFKETSIVNALLQYIKRSEDLIESNPHILLEVLTFLKVLWQGNAQYVQILEFFKTSEMFWKWLSSILEALTNNGRHKLLGNNSQSLAYKYQCHSAVLDIMAYDLFLEKKILQVDYPTQQSSHKSKASCPANVLNVWCESSALDNQIKSYASCEYDCEVLIHAKISSNMFLVHVMAKVITGDTGSLSLPLIGKIQDISKKLSSQPAFCELLTQYSQRGYSGGKELNQLILSDLYYHMQGELEGRAVNSVPFKELTQCLLQLNFYQTEQKYRRDFLDHASDAYVFDCVCLQRDVGLEYWDHSKWKTSKAVAERMLLNMRDANVMSFLSSSKLYALKALTTILSVYGGK
ncbi:nucleoporin, partial [Thalictrum thalictroides]